MAAWLSRSSGVVSAGGSSRTASTPRSHSVAPCYGAHPARLQKKPAGEARPASRQDGRPGIAAGRLTCALHMHLGHMLLQVLHSRGDLKAGKGRARGGGWGWGGMGGLWVQVRAPSGTPLQRRPEWARSRAGKRRWAEARWTGACWKGALLRGARVCARMNSPPLASPSLEAAPGSSSSTIPASAPPFPWQPRRPRRRARGRPPPAPRPAEQPHRQRASLQAGGRGGAGKGWVGADKLAAMSCVPSCRRPGGTHCRRLQPPAAPLPAPHSFLCPSESSPDSVISPARSLAACPAAEARSLTSSAAPAARSRTSAAAPVARSLTSSAAPAARSFTSPTLALAACKIRSGRQGRWVRNVIGC